ncbi:T9SS type A sorting domain-containing protein [bacterium]|nr:T9SS type A sorting domain-containing protein [bacterium]
MYKTLNFALLSILLISIPSALFSGNQAVEESHAAILNISPQAITLGFELSDVENATVFNDNQTFSRCIIKGEGLTYEHNMPLLPAVTRMVVVPPEAGLELIVRADEPRSVDADSPPEIFTDESIAAAFDENLPHHRGIYPPAVAEMSDPFVVRGARIVRVTTYPVRYDFDNDVYLHYDRIETEIVYTNDPPVNPSFVPQRRNRSPEFLKFINDFTINGDIVGRDDPDQDRELEYVGHYLVVTHENCLQYAAEFLEWRRQSGWKVDILSLPSNQASNARTVKEMIQERYDEYLGNGIDPFDQVFLIGDHPSYDGIGPGPNWILTSDVGNSCWPHNTVHNDWYYACLEGNDQAADVGISRWIAGTAQLLELFALRTLSYEVEPYMEDTEWFTRGAAYAEKWGGNYHISLATNVRYAKSVFEALGWDDVRVHENMVSNDRSVGPFITTQFNDGINVMAGRAENYYYRSGFVGVQESGIFPIDLNVAGHHEWSCWHMMRTSTPNRPLGPVAASTGWGGQQTLPYSVVWLEIVNGFLQRDMTFGWAHIKGLLGPEIYIPGWDNSYGRQCQTDVVFYGDPAIQFWRCIPQVVEADYQETIAPNDHLFKVHVTDAENEQNVTGARVTIYVPGEMPDPDDDDYAGYDGMFMLTTLTGEDGIGRFVLPQDNEFEPGPMHVTVTGRDILPNRGVVDIEQPDMGIELVESIFEQIAGNDDGNINPGERFFLNLTVRNLSRDNAVPNVEATVSVIETSPYLNVMGDDVIEFGTISAGNEAEGREGVEIAIAPDCPDGASRPITRPSLKIVFRSGERSWETALLLDPYAPNMVVKEVVGSGIISYDIEPLNIEIENIGRLVTTDITAMMVSMGMGVSVVDEEAHYPALHPGESARFAGSPPRVTGNRLVVPGSKYGMALVLETEEGFIDSAFFEVQISEERENAPQGPDAYGYICFDDTDSDWDVAPDYEWIEISIRDDDRQYDGEELDFDGTSQLNIGETIVVDLPFETQFYGHIYDQITVATNGFISMGDQEYVTNFQNWPMDRCQGGGVGMLAPLWDDLRLPDNGGVYCFYDCENSAFIVEWYRMRHRAGNNDDPDLIFQVLLYDRAVWITETGDQNILFQYKSIANVQGRAGWANASPFASVGISSPEGNSGINYTFNNVYPVTSAPLENHHAIYFATSPKYKAGALYGRVTCFETGQPIEGAVVSTQHGFMAITDGDGEWRINDALADIEFSLTCLKSGYNDSTEYNLMVEEDGELEINFELLHPEFHPSTWQINQMLDPGLTVILPYNIHNQGNGPLDWEMTRRLPGNAEVPPWELRTSYPVSEVVEDTRIEGVVFIDNRFYIAGANQWDREDGANMIYVLNREGELINEFEQVGESRYGMRDLAYDGELIWGSGADSVFGFTRDGEQVRSFIGPYSPNSSLAWDSDREVLWVSGRVSNEIVAYDTSGNEVARIPRFGLRLYGLAYWPGDPDGYPLYVFHSPDNLSQIIYKIDPDAPDTMFVAQLEHEDGGTPGGAFATNTFDVYSWVFIGIANDAGEDRIDIWQIDARRDWFRVFIEEEDGRIEISDGRIDATEVQDFELQLSSVGLPLETTFEGMLTYYHNADGTPSVIDVTLRVIGPMLPQPFGLLYPADNDTLDANIENTEITFKWEESIDNNYYDVVSYKIWFESRGERAMMESDACSLTVDLDYIAGNLGLSIEVEFPMFWRVWAYSGEDSVECHRRFSFMFLPNYISDSGENAPVEFGLHSIYPSPFNSSTTIRFGVDKRERFRLCIYDLTGRRVATLLDGMPAVGYHNLVWNAAALPSGMYIVHLESADRSQIRKTVLVR